MRENYLKKNALAFNVKRKCVLSKTLWRLSWNASAFEVY